MTSGPVESIVINNRRFTSDAEDTCEITPSGFENEVKPNGDGTQRIVKKRHIGKVEGLKLVIDQTAGDFEFLQETQDSLEFVPVQLTLVDGTVYNGEMQLTEAQKLDTKEGVAGVTLNGTIEKM